MLKWIVEKSLANRGWALGAFAAIAALGAYQVAHLPIDAVPDITNVQVMINARTGALDPERIETAVTYPIETEMAGLPGISDIRSISKYGLSQVTLVFQDGTDLYFVRQQAAQRLQNLNDVLPAGVTPELAPITTGLGEVVMYTVNAKPGSQLEKKSELQRLLYLRTIQDYVIRPELKKLDGVAEIDSGGGYRKEIHVNADTRKMERFAITFDDLKKRLQTLGESYGGGYIQREGQQIIVRSSSRLPDLQALEAIPVKLNFRGQPVLLRDVAAVREGHTPRLGAATENGEQAVLGTALMYIGANSRVVARSVVDALAKIDLPDDVETRVVYARSYLVDATIRTVAKSLLEGAGLVVIVLLLLLGKFRAAIAVALAIPISMLFAAIGMKFLGISANLMSLGAIDFGLLVDGSVVMVENLLRRFEERRAQELAPRDRLALVRDAAVEVGRPTALGLCVIMAVYAPILSLQGIEGKMFHPMALTVLMALAASLVVALTLMPVLGYLILRPPRLRIGSSKGSHSRLLDAVARVYLPFLRWSLDRTALASGAALVFALVCFGLFARLGSDFIPQLDEGDLVLGLARDGRIGLDESVAQQKKAELVIRGFPEVETVFSRLGTPESATDPMGVNFADTFVILKKDRALSPSAKADLAQAIADRIAKELPGHEVSPTQPIAMRFNEILEGSRADVSIRVFGSDLDKLMTYIDGAKAAVAKIDGVAGSEMDALTALRKSPILNVELDYGALARYGVDLQSANATLRMAMSGAQVGDFYEADRRFPVMLRLAEELREQPEEIKRIPVSLNDGGSVPLSYVANFKQSDQVTTIARSFGRRYAALSIYLKNRDVGGFVQEARAKIDAAMTLDPGYRLEWGGQFKNLERARLRLAIIIPLTLLAVLLLLYRAFKSARLTLLVASSIPMAMTGGVFALWARGISFSISAAVGFIALLGIAILNSMVLVDFINRLRAEGRPLREAIEEGARVRLRPVLMTALVAGLGFLPMALNHGLGSEVQRPLATVVIGGLITSTLLTLILLPTLYGKFAERSQPPTS